MHASQTGQWSIYDNNIDDVTFVIILPGGMRAQPVPFKDRAFKIPATLGRVCEQAASVNAVTVLFIK